MMTVVEISECFPNKFKPVTGEFILQHAKALSKHCKVIMIVPVRYVPPKELFTFNIFKTISNISRWYSAISSTDNFTEDNLTVIYTGFISFPRPVSESTDDVAVNSFFYGKIKKLIEPFKPDVIYCNWIRPWAELSFKLSVDMNIPFIVDHHEDLPTLKKIFSSTYGKFLNIFKKTDATVVHSSVNKSDLRDEIHGFDNIKIIHLGQNFNPEGIKKFSERQLKLVCVSHLYEERKNIDDLIKAAEILNGKLDFTLAIAGEGRLKQSYTELSQSLGLSDRIRFAGQMTQSQVSELLDQSDIFILPSFPEAFGVVFIEAIARGLPVITCKGNGGGEELQLLGYPVILTNPGSPEELAEAILRLSADKNKMQAMSYSGKELVRRHFTWEKNGEATFNFLNDVIGNFKPKKK